MPTAFTGSLGWTAAHPFQLGGPPLINTFDRKLPPVTPPVSGTDSPARPFIAHVYQNDGVTASGTVGVLNRPKLTPTLANGGYNQVLLSASALVNGMVWGQFIWGSQAWGGTSINIAQGNVVRLSEAGGDGSFVYGGIVEDLPETITHTSVSHQILLSPFAVELDDTFSQALYSTPTDVAQIVRDAVALTRHCSCDQVSVPAGTGILAATTGQLDFRNQAVRQVIDTCRSIAGPTWYWHCDELGRVWFQPMGSAAVYTIPMAQFEQRTKSASIQNRKNRIVAIGGVPTGGSVNVSAVVNGASQATLGVRALNPPLLVPTITDQAALSAIASSILTVLDRTWLRVNLKVLATYGRRIHASQPGGAMVRYWEPGVNPLQESSVGAGYTGPFIAQSVANDGMYQEVVAGDIPVTSQTDIANMVTTQVGLAAALSLQRTAAFLNLQQTLTGSFQSGTGTTNLQGQRGTLWSLGQQEFAAIDPNAVTRFEAGNIPANGISPAQWGARVSDANGVPIWDSLGLSQVMAQLNTSLFSPVSPQSITSVLPSYTLLTSSSLSFTLARATTVMALAAIVANDSTQTAIVDFFIDGVASTISLGAGGGLFWFGGGLTSTTAMAFVVRTLAAGSHTIDLRGGVGVASTLSITQYNFSIFQLGG